MNQLFKEITGNFRNVLQKARGYIADHLDDRRLRGQLTFVWPFNLLRPQDILWIKPLSAGGAYLLAARLRESHCSSRELLYALLAVNMLGPDALSDHEKKTIHQAGAYRLLRLRNTKYTAEVLKILNSKSIDANPIRESKNETTTFLNPYVLKINPYKYLHKDYQYRNKAITRYTVGPGCVITLPQSRATVESDYVQSLGKYFVDVNQWKGSENHNLINDSRLLSVRIGSRKAIIEKDTTEPIWYDYANWLAAPMLSNWGHFVLEGLLRLELLDRDPQGGQEPTIISSTVPENFVEIAKLIFPSFSPHSHDPGQLISAHSLRIAPLRSFNPHNLHYTKRGEDKRLNGEPELFSALKHRINQLAIGKSQLASRVFLDRANAKYRISRNQERMRSIALSNGFQVVDPGSLSPLEEIQLFLQAETLWGQTGSAFCLAPLVKEGTKVLMVGSDFSHDGGGLSESISLAANRKVDLITGKRDFVAKGFSEPLCHQDFSLSKSAWQSIEKWCSEN